MTPDSKKPYVAVLYNFCGEDEYEVLRRKVRRGEVVSPTGDSKDLENISTLREEIQAIVEALIAEGFEARAVNIEDSFDRLFGALTSPRPDVVFNLVEFFNDDARQEDRVAALYDLLRIPYTGSPPMTLAICQRKGLAKRILRTYRVNTPRYKQAKERPVLKLTGLRYPLIVKPAWEDASAGVDSLSVVEDRTQLESRVHKILDEYSQPAIIEEYIEGREFGVSVMGNAKPRVLPFEELDFSDIPPNERPIISWQSKWDPLHEVFHLGKLVCPAKVPRALRRKIEKMALRTYQAMGCRDYARIDVRLDSKNRPYVLEVNPNPDLTQGVGFMASAMAAGYSFSAVLRMIVEEALERGNALKAAEPAACAPSKTAGGAGSEKKTPADKREP